MQTARAQAERSHAQRNAGTVFAHAAAQAR